MRAAFTVFVAIALTAAAPAFAADAQSHVAAAKHAERRGEWHKALTEWKAAYSSDVNAEYLIGIGDSYSHLGNKAEARKNYEAYLADPLALPGNMDRVRAKLSRLDGSSGGDALALPGTGSGPGLALPGADTPPLGLPDPGAPAPEASNKRNKRKKGGGGDTLALPGPGLTLPGSTPPPNDPGLTLPGPGLSLPGTEQSPSKPTRLAANDPNTLVLPGSTPPPPAARPIPPPPPKQQVAIAQPQPTKPISTNPPPQRVPNEVVTNNPRPLPEAQSGGGSKTAAWVVAGVAVVALGGGAFMYTKSSSAHSDLTGSVHSSSDAASLLSTEKTDKTLSFVGVAAGLVAGGVAAALFAF